MADAVALTQTAVAVAETVASPINAVALTLTLSRWIHYVAGVLWIGHLYFFNFVNLNYQPEVPADIKKIVNPPLLIRVLFFFRWGAMFTFITGLIMLGILWSSMERWTASPQGHYMALGTLFGSIMWFNVWFIIWPNQKKNIIGMQGGPPADPALIPKTLRASKINTYLSVPMLLGMMGGAHGEYQLPGGHAGLLCGTLLGFAIVWLAYKYAPKVDSKLFKG